MPRLHRFHLHILCSIWFALACLLGLQFGLNHLKYRSLVIDTTASRMQIGGATIATSIRKAEQLGLAFGSSQNLGALLEREMRREPLIDAIRLLSPVGDEIAATAPRPWDAAERGAVLRRVLAREDEVVTMEAGPSLHTVRRLTDSTGGYMGAVVLSTSTSAYRAEISNTDAAMARSFGLIFAAVSLLTVPAVLFGFREAGRVMAVFDDADLERLDPVDPGARGDDPAAALRAQIVEGNRAYAAVRRELDEIERRTKLAA